MTAHQKYESFLDTYGLDLLPTQFFNTLAQWFDLSPTDTTVMDIWYAPQRSWYQPEMMDFIVTGQHIEAGVNLRTGGFTFSKESGFASST